MNVTRFSVGGAILCLVATAALLQTGTRPGSAEEKSRAIASQSDSNAIVGTVVMWWGAKSDIPAGWELCDGQKVKTPGSTLTGIKPNLIDRFPKGAVPSRNSVDDLRQGLGGSHNMPALQITNIDSLKIAEDGEHTHASLELASGTKEGINQADNQESSELTIAQTKRGAKQGKSQGGKETTITEGRHSHQLSGFVGTDGGVNADGDDKTGANQPAYAELFFIIRVK